MSFYLFRALVGFALCFSSAVYSDVGANSSGTVHWSGEQMFYRHSGRIVELRKSASVADSKVTVTADSIDLDLEAETLHAEGQAVMVSGSETIRGRVIDLNLQTGTGHAIAAELTNGSFWLKGAKIERVDSETLLVDDGEYTTCRDCAASWSLRAHSAKYTKEDYLILRDVTAQVKDAPMFWLPGLILPTKTMRQSGLIMPRINSGIHGFEFVPRYFWAPHKSFDFLAGIGSYGARGVRMEGEFRAQLTDRSFFKLAAFLTRDQLGDPGTAANKGWRGAISADQRAVSNFGLDQKLRWYEISDNRYPVLFAPDVPGRFEPVLTSEFNLTQSFGALSAQAQLRRHRNLLGVPGTESQVLDRFFDNDIVQELPKLRMFLQDQWYESAGIGFGLETGLNYFYRPSEVNDIYRSDQDVRCEVGSASPECDVLRRATRVRVAPRIYGAWSVQDALRITPSLTMHAFAYDFSSMAPGLWRSYLLSEIEFSSEIWRVFRDEDDVSLVRHAWIPSLTYSYIPKFLISENTGHRFIRQMNLRPEFRFDHDDVVPYATTLNSISYFAPQGNAVHINITSILQSRDAGKAIARPTGVSYTTWNKTQLGTSLDLLEFAKSADEQVPIGRINLISSGLLGKLEYRGEFYFTPGLSRLARIAQDAERSPSEVTTTVGFVWERALHQGFLDFDRSVSTSLNFNRGRSGAFTQTIALRFSINDYLMPGASVVFDYNHAPTLSVVQQWGVDLALQHPSKCWRLQFGINDSPDRQMAYTFKAGLNLSGSGFYGVDEATRGILPQ